MRHLWRHSILVLLLTIIIRLGNTHGLVIKHLLVPLGLRGIRLRINWGPHRATQILVRGLRFCD
jgi:hypothetical protein